MLGHILNNSINSKINTLEFDNINRRLEVFQTLSDDANLTPLQASEFLQTYGLPAAVKTLAKWRCVRSDGPKYLKIGNGRIVYRVSDLRAYLRPSA
jgi:hypothetical protein